MIARVWRGWTSQANADAYENLLREIILPSFTRIDGYRGGTIYRENRDQEKTEFMITNFFSSLEAVKAFAGQENYAVAVIEPEARALLTKVEPLAKHYEVKEAFLLDTLLNPSQ